jgi:26S proteasome regulatory subunit T5
MSDSQPPADAGRSDGPADDKGAQASSSSAPAPSAAAASAANGDSKDSKMETEEEEWPEEIRNASAEDLMTRVRMLDNDIRVSGASTLQRKGPG